MDSSEKKAIKEQAEITVATIEAIFEELESNTRILEFQAKRAKLLFEQFKMVGFNDSQALALTAASFSAVK